LRRWNLNPVRLPIPPLSQVVYGLQNVSRSDNSLLYLKFSHSEKT